MPAAARSQGEDTVLSLTGAGGESQGCPAPLETSTDQGSSDVLINGVGAVRIGDAVAFHRAIGCGPDLSTLTSASSKVFANNQGVGIIGGQYTSDNIITSGSRDVFVGR